LAPKPGLQQSVRGAGADRDDDTVARPVGLLSDFSCAWRITKLNEPAGRAEVGKMVLTVFGTTWRADADLAREARLSRQMAAIASQRPGFISYKSYVASDGDQIGIIRFESREALRAWRDDSAHHGAWQEAPTFYHEFWVQNCEVFDDYVWVDGVHIDRNQRDRFQMTPAEVLAAVDAESDTTGTSQGR
jgi:heme-degrading monooxygenase HmoA